MKLPPRCGNRLLSFALGAAPSVAGFDGSIGDSAGGGTVRVVAMVKACAFADRRAIVLSDRWESAGQPPAAHRSSFICAFPRFFLNAAAASSSADGGSRHS